MSSVTICQTRIVKIPKTTETTFIQITDSNKTITMPTGLQLPKLIRSDFFWDVRVTNLSTHSPHEMANDVWCTLTLKAADEQLRETKIMLEMSPKDLDKVIAELKKKV